MNCKPGDLAIITNVKFKRNKGNIGRVVEIIGPGTTPPFDRDSFYWLCKAQGEPLNGVNIFGDVLLAHQSNIADSCLRPISGIPVHDEQHDEVTV